MTNETQRRTYKELLKAYDQVITERDSWKRWCEEAEAKRAASPCACGGRTPIKDVRTDAIASGSIHGDGRYHINITLSTACKTISIPVHVLVFYAPPGGKP